MLQVAWLAPTQSSAELVGGFFREHDPAGGPSTGPAFPTSTTPSSGSTPGGAAGAGRRRPHPRPSHRVGDGAALDFVLSPWPGAGPTCRGVPPVDVRQRCSSHATFRAGDGARDRSGRRRRIAYGAFVALGAYQDCEPVPDSGADGAAADAGTADGGLNNFRRAGRAHYATAAAVAAAPTGKLVPERSRRGCCRRRTRRAASAPCPGRPSRTCCPRPRPSTRWSGCTRTSRP
jgi:hypothetical protein